MLPTEIKVGHVFRYSYLWHWQYLEGREEGDKDRPCLVLALVTTLEDGTPAVRVLPIYPYATGQARRVDRDAPDDQAAALGLMTSPPGLCSAKATASLGRVRISGR